MRVIGKNDSGAEARAWYCFEFYDDGLGHHSMSATFTTQSDADRVLRAADRVAPPSTHIYYWRSDEKPFFGPPGGHTEGPLAGPPADTGE